MKWGGRRLFDTPGVPTEGGKNEIERARENQTLRKIVLSPTPVHLRLDDTAKRKKRNHHEYTETATPFRAVLGRTLRKKDLPYAERRKIGFSKPPAA